MGVVSVLKIIDSIYINIDIIVESAHLISSVQFELVILSFDELIQALELAILMVYNCSNDINHRDHPHYLTVNHRYMSYMILYTIYKT